MRRNKSIIGGEYKPLYSISSLCNLVSGIQGEKSGDSIGSRMRQILSECQAASIEAQFFKWSIGPWTQHKEISPLNWSPSDSKGAGRGKVFQNKGLFLSAV